MAGKTTNYGWTKPEANDWLDIGVISEVFEQIDEQMKAFEGGYLPLTGGTLSGYELWIQNGKARLFSGDNVFRLDAYNEPKTDNNRRALWMANSSKNDAVDIKDAFRFADVINGKTTLYPIYGRHNKPTGTYTGNGSATSRTIQIGGIGELLMINSVNATCIVSSHGASYWCNDDGTTKYKGNPTIKFENGQLTITSSEKFFNANGVSYTYRVL